MMVTSSTSTASFNFISLVAFDRNFEIDRIIWKLKLEWDGEEEQDMNTKYGDGAWFEVEHASRYDDAIESIPFVDHVLI